MGGKWNIFGLKIFTLEKLKIFGFSGYTCTQIWMNQMPFKIISFSVSFSTRNISTEKPSVWIVAQRCMW